MSLLTFTQVPTLTTYQCDAPGCLAQCGHGDGHCPECRDDYGCGWVVVGEWACCSWRCVAALAVSRAA